MVENPAVQRDFGLIAVIFHVVIYAEEAIPGSGWKPWPCHEFPAGISE